MMYPYIAWMERKGISVKLLRLQFYSTRFNRAIHLLGRKRPIFVYWWFTVGTVVSLCAVVPSVWILVTTARSVYYGSTGGREETQILQPAMPGINLPLSDIFYYVSTLVMCSAIHELGHALAAVRENVRVQGCGLFVLGIFPGAYVDLPQDQVSILPAWRQLKIYCAGIWHNIVLVAIAFCLLQGNPLLLEPFYKEHSGVSVVHVSKGSGATGPSGLMGGDHIVAIDDCVVTSVESWRSCLLKTVIMPQYGFCQKKEFLQSEPTSDGEGDCCKGDPNTICFAYADSDRKKQVCLPARHTIESASRLCNTSCPIGSLCLVPILENGTKLVQVKRENWRTMLFLGPPSELWFAVTVNRWVPRLKFLSALPVHVYEVFLNYIMSFSGALAVLNCVPCLLLDGQWILQGVIKLMTHPLPCLRRTRKPIYLILIFSGTLLLLLNVVLGFHKLFVQR